MRWAAVLALFAVTGCGEHDSGYWKQRAQADEKWKRQQAYERCLFEAKGYFGTASIEVVRHCEARALREVPEWKP